MSEKKKKIVLIIVAIPMSFIIGFLGTHLLGNLMGNDLIEYINDAPNVIYDSYPLHIAYKSVPIDANGDFGVGYASTSYCIYGSEEMDFMGYKVLARSELMIGKNETIEKGDSLIVDVDYYISGDTSPVACIDVKLVIENIYASRIGAISSATTNYATYKSFDCDQIKRHAREMAIDGLSYFDAFLIANEISDFHRK